MTRAAWILTAVLAVPAGCASGAARGTPAGAAVPAPLSWSEFRTLAPVEPELRLRWGEEPEQVGELHLPAGEGPHPVVVLLHGGCWLSIADTGYMSHLARHLVVGGWAVWAPEYRRVDMPGGAWPGILTDAAAGTDHLRRLARSHPLDLDRVVLVGHSSGGHLALWLAGRTGMATKGGEGRLRGRDPLPVRGVVGLAAIAGVADYHAIEGGGCGPEAVPTLLGGAPSTVPDRLRLAEPGGRLPPDLPVLLATGELDTVVPLVHGKAFARTAPAAVRVVPVPGAGHFEVVAPWTPGFLGLWNEMEPFLRQVTRLSPDEGRR